MFAEPDDQVLTAGSRPEFTWHRATETIPAHGARAAGIRVHYDGRTVCACAYTTGPVCDGDLAVSMIGRNRCHIVTGDTGSEWQAETLVCTCNGRKTALGIVGLGYGQLGGAGQVQTFRDLGADGVVLVGRDRDSGPECR